MTIKKIISIFYFRIRIETYTKVLWINLLHEYTIKQ